MSLDLSYLGIVATKAVYRNLPVSVLTEKAVARGEGTLSNTGALVVKTGKYTGRSANDKFIVDSPMVHDEIAWGKVNRPIEKEKYDAIRSKVIAYLQGKEIFIFDGFAGADPKYMKGFRIINELASQNLFIHQLLIRPTAEELEKKLATAWEEQEGRRQEEPPEDAPLNEGDAAQEDLSPGSQGSSSG